MREYARSPSAIFCHKPPPFPPISFCLFVLPCQHFLTLNMCWLAWRTFNKLVALRNTMHQQDLLKANPFVPNSAHKHLFWDIGVAGGLLSSRLWFAIRVPVQWVAGWRVCLPAISSCHSKLLRWVAYWHLCAKLSVSACCLRNADMSDMTAFDLAFLDSVVSGA